MEISGRRDITAAMNRLGGEGEPFFFIIDFDGESGVVMPLSMMSGSGLSCCVRGTEIGQAIENSTAVCNCLNIEPVTQEVYRKGFENVIRNINEGNSYLLNLTYRTCLGTDIDMAGIYSGASAPYKFLWPGRFLFFSPEAFVKIEGGRIFSFPMKGTIDALLPDAERRLLNDYKELFEHNTIVDLIRNDLSIVATDVRVESFRYMEEVKSASGTLLQSSSRVSGALPAGWKSRLGSIIYAMLPAGSISGAPKDKTLQIIRGSEISPRGYYTGVMGIFNGDTVDSCVIIRYIEAGDDGKFYYRSGGGITSMSCMEDEYNELIAKIYVPVV